MSQYLATRVQSGWRVYIDYRKLNKATNKDCFSLPSMDQILERLAERSHYCFLDGYLGYIQIPTGTRDQKKITFTYPFGIYAFKRMSFVLCNAPATFKRMHDEHFIRIYHQNYGNFHR